MKATPQIDKNHVLNEVIKIARRAGDFIRHEGAHFDRTKIEEKNLNDLVSYVDREAEKIIVQTLKFTLPAAGFITEEGTETESSEEFNWVVDPLDGTTNFLHGLAPHCVSIALMYKEKVVLGVVYEITRDECFYATDEGKAYLNRKEIQVSPVNKFEEGLYITGFPYREFDKVESFLGAMEYFMKNTHGLRRTGSAAADLAFVAAGRCEGFFESGLKPWDAAAGVLILQQAGGTITDFSGGEDYIFGGTLIAGNAVQPKMVEALKKFY